MQERKAWHANGFLALLLSLILVGGAIVLFIVGGTQENSGDSGALSIILGIVAMMLGFVIMTSLTVVQPNQAKIITFFGKYKGTVVDSGLWIVIPFTGKSRVSLKVRNFNSQKLKVNDASGNPVEIAAVIVFKVTDTAKASFDVDNYEKFVEIQSETAVRHIAAQYPYDSYEDDGSFSLRGNADEVSSQLMAELQTRLMVAGVQVLETRLSHLAYAPEIANAMLQRQQAAAIVSARHKIVDGAVGMVESALQQLELRGIVLDDERRAAMINNLMVAIVSERGMTPVINAGTLYS
ncbi:SPFH domain-containing protein [Paenibacillus nasutitermitis]|uniref:Membrane protein n=1 Tax=Paenibacillus nasutitermitis TaxID=1652958 RepID=A0A917E3P5_9BACL|nr:SPFH domain-containing protein [Paenibacillus nasutitermitis]GGE01914.1 membrane protein [Paenibacillus nasutitermitis]